jgi:hypothetical protein
VTGFLKFAKVGFLAQTAKHMQEDFAAAAVPATPA